MNIVETFEHISIEHLREYIERKQEEHLYLDFKILRDASLASLDYKRNLARALSGFANSSGGLIIWGVEARKKTTTESIVPLHLRKLIALLFSYQG